MVFFPFLFLLSQLSFAASPLPIPEVEKLKNGLEVVWFADDKRPVVDFSVLVKVGSRDDPEGKSGLMELLESSLDRGADGMTAQQISHTAEMLGAVRYTNVDEDSFSVGIHGLSPDGPDLLALLGKLVTRADLPEKQVEQEKDRLIDRLNHIQDYSEAMAAQAFHRVLASGTSYGRESPIAQVKTVTRNDLATFYKKYFTPKNSILMIVGRVDPVVFRQRIVESFGAWTGEEPSRVRGSYSDSRLSLKKKEILLVDRPNSTQAHVRIGFKAPLINSPDHYPLVVWNALVGEYFNSRLNLLIRDRLGLTYGIGSAFAFAKEYAEFAISASTRNDATGQLLRKTLEVLQEIKNGGILSSELEASKDYLQGRFPVNNVTLSSQASKWLAGYFYGLGSDYLNDYLPQVKKVSLQEVQAASKKYTNLDDVVIVVAGDAKEIKKSLNAENFKSIKQVGVLDLK